MITTKKRAPNLMMTKVLQRESLAPLWLIPTPRLTPCLPLGASWTPAPIHPDIEIADDAARQMDTVSLLVQIYGSDDLFIQVSRFKMEPLTQHVQA